MIDETLTDEPTTSLPETASGSSAHDDIVAKAMDEATENADVVVSDDAVAAQPDDEQVAPVVESAPFPLYDEKGAKVEDWSKVTLADFFAGKVKVGYKAMDKEHQKTFAEAMRNASLGHYNEHKMNTLLNERQQLHQQYSTMKTEHEQWAADRRVWEGVLAAAYNGNVTPLQQVIERYGKALGEMPAAPTPVNREDEMAQGQQFVLEHIIPAANKLASTYGANPTEITKAILTLVQNEPVEFLTQEKVNAIINYEMPALLEQYGYKPSANAAGAQPANLQQQAAAGNQPDDRYAKLEAKVLELQAKLANDETNRVKNKLKKVPVAGGGATTGSGESMPNMRNRQDMKKFLRGEID